MHRSFVMAIIFVTYVSNAPAGVFGERPLLVGVKGSFTTSTRFLYNVDQPDDFLNTKNVSSSYGIGGDIRWNMLWERFYLGVSAEKIRSVEASSSYYYTGYSYLKIPIEEGFEVYPVEISGYYVVPISSENITFYLGGGIGFYQGERIYTYGGVKAATMNSPSSYGIHVVTGTDFKIFSRFIVRGELRFRDPQFTSINKFEQSETIVDGRRIRLAADPTKTQINLNGINYSVTLAVEL